ncbi:MAG: Orf2 family protein [Rhodospirillales bacterium]|jgi:transposase|nr:Orf2 family protein [Rhodospirillales bacterium]MDB5382344.1 Orf2 family protein [Rhodospirillales bacterium]
MLALNTAMRVHLALGTTDMCKGFDGLAAQVQTALKADPFSGHLFLFRGKRGDLLKALWWDGQSLVLLAKRLEKAGSSGRRSRAKAP